MQRNLRRVRSGLRFFHAPLLHVLRLGEPARRGIHAQSVTEVVTQVEARAELRMVTAEVVVLAVEAQAEFTFERRPLPAQGGMRRVGERTRLHDVLQVVGCGPAESGGDARVEARGT